MTVTHTPSAVLTSLDLSAMRHADAICFDHTATGEGKIRAIRYADHTDTGFEQTHTIAVASSRIRSHDRTHDLPMTGFSHHSHPVYNDVMMTLMRHMKPGAQVCLIWTRGNSSPVIDEAGIVRDELRVQVVHRGHTDTFLINVQVGRDNSARMVKLA